MYRGERFNGYSHLLGTLLAIIAATALIVYGANHGDAWRWSASPSMAPR